MAISLHGVFTWISVVLSLSLVSCLPLDREPLSAESSSRLDIPENRFQPDQGANSPPSSSPVPSAAATPTPTPTPIPTPTQALAPTPTPLAIVGTPVPPKPTATVTPTQMVTPTPTPTLASTPTPSATPAARAAPDQLPIGEISNARGGILKGWAQDPDTPAQPLVVRVYKEAGPEAGGTLLGEVLASRPGTNGNHAFEFTLPSNLYDGEARSIYAYALNSNPAKSGALLAGSGKTVQLLPDARKVGVLYQVALAFPFHKLSGGSTPLLSMEAIRRDPARHAGEWYRHGLGTIHQTFNLIYFVTQTNPVNEQAQPQPYCFFDGVPNEAPFNTINCNRAQMRAALRRHVRQLQAMGVDFLVLDNTNAYDFDPINPLAGFGSEVTYFRPLDVFLAEWKLASEEIEAAEATRGNLAFEAPKLTIFGVANTPPQQPYYRRMLTTLYDRPEYDSVFFKHQGKKVFFYVDPAEASNPPRPEDRVPTAENLAEIARHSILPVPMWTHGLSYFEVDTRAQSRYRMDFMAPCQVSRNGKTYGSTTSFLSGSQCDQYVTTQSPLGKTMTVSPSYQVPGAVASQAFGATGRLRGLTLKKQFEKVFREQPGFLMISSWNEHGAGPLFVRSYGTPVGMGDRARPFPSTPREQEADRLVSNRYSELIALYDLHSPASDRKQNALRIKSNLRAEFSIPDFLDFLDLVQNKFPELGSALMNYSHYVDTYGAEYSRDIEPTQEYGREIYDLTSQLVRHYKLGHTSCDPGLPYCQMNLNYQVVAAGKKPSAASYVYSSTAEWGHFAGQGYRQVCSLTGAQSEVCADPNEAEKFATPFISYNANRANHPNVVPILRCFNGVSGAYFFTTSAGECSAHPAYVPSGIVGYVAATKNHPATPEMTRILNRCRGPNFHLIAVDSPCPTGYIHEGVLGYAH